ncbi:MAG: hypothetical protein J5735_05685 [Prevotella sp.]|nr:hypothetical protein [Prevotella sp.]
MTWTATKDLTVNAYSDLSYFPWIKYYANASSYSFDNNISLKYSKNKWNIQAKYKFKIRQRNNSEKTEIINRYSNKLRFTIQRESDNISTSTIIDLSKLTYHGFESQGYSITQNLSIQTCKRNNIYAFLSYFNTDDSNSSIYLSERTIPGSYSPSNFYGEGIRFSAIIKQQLTPIVLINFKVGFTKYFNKNSISTGLRMIEHSYQTDIDLSIKCKF